MKLSTVTVGAGLVVVAGIVLYRALAPRAFVAAGRGAAWNASSLSVTRVSVSPTTLNYDGKTVQAGPGRAYVLLDCRIALPVSQVRFDDFQLVRDRATTGAEQNVGDNNDSDYFYWTFVDDTGRPVAQLTDQTVPFTARLSFKVPSAAPTGYLFYWGLYWGPFDLAKGGGKSPPS